MNPPSNLPGSPSALPDREIALFDGVAPGSEKWNWTERSFTNERGAEITENVVRPVLHYYAPKAAKACGTAVIIAPGGGAVALMMSYEGKEVARYLTALGISAFILKYRLVYEDPQRGPPLPGQVPALSTRIDPAGLILKGPQAGQNIAELTNADAEASVTWIRRNAHELGIAANRIGMIGFSAGGWVLMGLMKGQIATRPDFGAAIYGPGFDQQIPGSDAPPLFLAVASDDELARDGSIRLYLSWQKAGRPVELHLFQSGGHGFQNKGGGGDRYLDRFADWMRSNGWLTASV